MSTLPVIGANELVSGQALPETSVNEALRHLCAGHSRARPEDRDLSAPPGTCDDGASYLVAATATGAWAGQDGKLAISVGTDASNGWLFQNVEREGFRLYVKDENVEIQWNGSSWITVASSGNPTESFEVAMSNMVDDLTTGDAQAGWVVPYDFTLSEVFTGLLSAQSSSGSVTIDARQNGTTIFTTPPSIQASEDTSLTGTAAVLNITALTKGDIILLDVDAAGTGAKGLVVVFVGSRT